MMQSDEVRAPTYAELRASVVKLQAEQAAHRALSPAVKHFDHLPDEARIPDRDVAEIEGVNRSTIWRWVNDGAYPAPIKQCGTTRWSVGDIRAHHARITGTV